MAHRIGSIHYRFVSSHTFRSHRWLETNPFGARVGEVFGTIAWLWVFHRFRQDGAVLLGYAHPWDHGHDDHHGSSHAAKKLEPEEKVAMWEKFSDRATIPGEDDDDDDDEDVSDQT